MLLRAMRWIVLVSSSMGTEIWYSRSPLEFKYRTIYNSGRAFSSMEGGFSEKLEYFKRKFLQCGRIL